MAFSEQATLVPTSIGVVRHFLDDKDGTTPNRSMKFKLQVLDQDSDIMNRRFGNEQPHLDGTQITQLLNFLTARRTAFPSDLSISFVGRIIHFMTDLDGTNPGKSMAYRVQEVSGIGAHIAWHRGDEQPFLTAGQLTTAIDFLDTQRGKAETQILP